MPRKRSTPRNQKYCELTAIKGLIREKKDSYAKISEALNIAPNTLCRKINGEQIFDCNEVDAIADRLEIDTDKILHYFFPHRLSGATLEEYLSKHKSS
ncbi:helix-turn-helix domain-containing protein [Desulfosporosinus nitroreducens]|uniref:helix-turn-helix domain-containing protein n=1 Tax=Desulfosporosinus nitroreducens TaxID=2018668 RepID=UPI00207D2124|nr:helix-turn-helix transcriptional regulator [Desulfosporosinus nitroreducens]MCO1599875.1 helix-turn-helix domain-containing protein [Desulfosporosinus nitroreducens]